MKFIDEATIEVRSGNGGRGAVAFMRQKFMPKMGPAGGDGGKGGSVCFEATHDMQSLLDFKYQPHYAAENGEHGASMDCNGRAGEDLIIKVPVGTVLRDGVTGQFLADLVEPGVRLMLMKGGRGGLGNMNFATASRQAPDFAQPGETGIERTIRLELKLLADVALVGFPNAGKSTLISRWSAARPKIANYPFTTLVPNLGVVRGKSSDFVLADIPGIIEGAAEGRGLGVQFLKHAERTRVIVLLIDLDPFTGRDLAYEYQVLKTEMGSFSPELMAKPRVIALNKADSLQAPDLEERGLAELQAQIKADGLPEAFMVSAVTGQGLDALKEAVETRINELGPRKFENKIERSLMLGNAALFRAEARRAEAAESEAPADEEIVAEDADAVAGDTSNDETGREES